MREERPFGRTIQPQVVVLVAGLHSKRQAFGVSRLKGRLQSKHFLGRGDSFHAWEWALESDHQSELGSRAGRIMRRTSVLHG